MSSEHPSAANNNGMSTGQQQQFYQAPHQQVQHYHQSHHGDSHQNSLQQYQQYQQQMPLPNLSQFGYLESSLANLSQRVNNQEFKSFQHMNIQRQEVQFKSLSSLTDPSIMMTSYGGVGTDHPIGNNIANANPSMNSKVNIDARMSRNAESFGSVNPSWLAPQTPQQQQQHTGGEEGSLRPLSGNGMSLLSTGITTASRPITIGKRRISSRWTDEEDKLLIAAYVRNNGRNWSQISKEVGTNKTSDQCNQHWHRVLNPGIVKEPWRGDDDQRLIQRVKEVGESSWKKVSGSFRGRTDLQCRHRWLQLKKNKTSKRPKQRTLPFPLRRKGDSDEEIRSSMCLGMKTKTVNRETGQYILPIQPQLYVRETRSFSMNPAKQHSTITQDENGQSYYGINGAAVGDKGWSNSNLVTGRQGTQDISQISSGSQFSGVVLPSGNGPPPHFQQLPIQQKGLHGPHFPDETQLLTMQHPIPTVDSTSLPLFNTYLPELELTGNHLQVFDPNVVVNDGSFAGQSENRSEEHNSELP